MSKKENRFIKMSKKENKKEKKERFFFNLENLEIGDNISMEPLKVGRISIPIPEENLEPHFTEFDKIKDDFIDDFLWKNLTNSNNKKEK